MGNAELVRLFGERICRFERHGDQRPETTYTGERADAGGELERAGV